MTMRKILLFTISICFALQLQSQQKQANPWYYQAPNDTLAAAGIDSAQKLLRNIVPAEIVVAVIDAGVDTNHIALQDHIWVNKDEIPGNNIDDDNNGYIDDTHGWNFLGNQNGENLQGAPYEFVRIYDTLQHKFKTPRYDSIPKGENAQLDLYREVSAEYNKRVKEINKRLSTYNKILEGYNEASKILNKHIDKKDYDLDDIRKIDAQRKDVEWAVNYYTKLADRGISKQNVETRVRTAQSVLKTKLNPDYHPRKIINDNVKNIRDSIYGNNDVNGGTASHGTAVAGIITTNQKYKIGFKGIAPKVKIMPVRAIPGGDEWDKDVALAIRYAVNNGADIINGSFGKMYSPNKQMVDSAIRYAAKNDVLVVLGAGNDHKNNDLKPNYPNKFYADSGIAPNVISVGATNHNSLHKMVASFSNYGKRHVDIFAPGVNIQALNTRDRARKISGTSAASPVVTGVAALIKVHYPAIKAPDLKTILMESVTDYSGLDVKIPGSSDTFKDFDEICTSGGVINAYKAVSLTKKLFREGKL
ncbi:MAG: S8 family serine peptidase [Bacteroidales bacterium]|nr:S8 family serine peptidase [Bacteroidales bacterium]MCF8328014.1 S8 family serine peptidase [Bacteroidales bacterium]